MKRLIVSALLCACSASADPELAPACTRTAKYDQSCVNEFTTSTTASWVCTDGTDAERDANRGTLQKSIDQKTCRNLGFPGAGFGSKSIMWCCPP